MVPVVPPDQLQPVDLGQLLGAARQQPTAPSLSCQHQGCPVAGARGMPSHLVPTPGQVLRQLPTNEDASPVQGAGESYFEHTLRCTISVAFGHWTTWRHHHSGDRVGVALLDYRQATSAASSMVGSSAGQ